MPFGLGSILLVAGIILIAVAAIRARPSYGRMQDLDRLADNSRRYDSWRGGSRTAAGSNESGADVMRALLRRQVLTWAAVGAAGGALVVVGLLLR